MNQSDFTTKVLGQLLTAAQINSVAVQLGISTVELNTPTRLEIASLALQAWGISVSIDLNNQNNASNQVITSMLGKIPTT